jgi:hypothetical protein
MTGIRRRSAVPACTSRPTCGSLNAEVIENLDGVVERERSGGLITDKLRELAIEINWPDDAPTPEQMIREMRDADDPRGV